jgi:hypothetical protein
MGFLQAGFRPLTKPAQMRPISARESFISRSVNQNDVMFCHRRVRRSLRGSSLRMGRAESAGACSAARLPTASAQSMQRFGSMDKDPSVDVIVKRTEIGRGRRVVILVAVVLVAAGLIGVVAVGFRGRNIPQNAAAMTTPVPPTAKAGWRPWWLQ